jgi:methyl-accepting chemotaxis protein
VEQAREAMEEAKGKSDEARDKMTELSKEAEQIFKTGKKPANGLDLAP